MRSHSEQMSRVTLSARVALMCDLIKDLAWVQEPTTRIILQQRINLPISLWEHLLVAQLRSPPETLELDLASMMIRRTLVLTRRALGLVRQDLKGLKRVWVQVPTTLRELTV